MPSLDLEPTESSLELIERSWLRTRFCTSCITLPKIWLCLPRTSCSNLFRSSSSCFLGSISYLQFGHFSSIRPLGVVWDPNLHLFFPFSEVSESLTRKLRRLPCFLGVLNPYPPLGEPSLVCDAECSFSCEFLTLGCVLVVDFLTTEGCFLMELF